VTCFCSVYTVTHTNTLHDVETETLTDETYFSYKGCSGTPMKKIAGK